MLSARLITFFFILPVVIASIVIDYWVEVYNVPFLIISIAFQVVLCIELLNICHTYFAPLLKKKPKKHKDKHKPRHWKQNFSYYFVILSTLCQYLLVWLKESFPHNPPIQFFFKQTNIIYLIPLLFFIIYAFTKLFTKNNRKSLAEISCYALIIIIAGYIFPFFLKIKALNHGLIHLFFFCSVIWANDITAYLVGRFLGKHKAGIPASPNKSIEGFIGGIAGSWIMLLLFFMFTSKNFLFFHDWRGLVITAILALLCPISDLIESEIKRSAKVKNSGNIVPGRGGVFDSIDSLLFCAPFYYFLIKLLL
jgi:phosphatidate cytidylyltransferase